MIAYLRGNLVVWIGGNSQAPSVGLAYDEMRDGPEVASASIGQVWNGSAYVAPQAGSEQANAATISQQADDAIAANVQTVADIDAWLAGPGAGTANLTAAQLSSAVRSLMRGARVAAKQRNGIIRLLRGKFEATT